jgi:hypothetical protein
LIGAVDNPDLAGLADIENGRHGVASPSGVDPPSLILGR